MQLISQEKIEQALDWAYEKSVNGVAGLDSAFELADSYMKGDASLHDKVNSLIRYQNTKAATSGFISGLGGMLTLPVALPANITSVLYVQIRMIAAIAHMGGHDIRDDRVKTLVYSCLVANSAKDVAKNLGITVGSKIATNAIKAIPGKTLTEINKRVGFRLITKFGEKGVINLGKAIPLLGGLIGGSFDAYATNKVGDVARDTFLTSEAPSESPPKPNPRASRKAADLPKPVAEKRPRARRKRTVPSPSGEDRSVGTPPDAVA